MSRRFPLLLYVGTIMLVTAIITGSFLAKAQAGGLSGWMLGLIGILSLLGASHLAIALVNWLATLLVTPQPLPRMDFSEGIPPESRTLVVVPTMLTSPQNIAALIEALEVRFLANRDENLHFGLLTDFRDAPAETLPEDEPLVQLARQGIEALNEKYRSAKGDIFFLFHRPRRWNPRGADLDGLRAQARQACGLEFLSARRLQGLLLSRRRRDCSLIGREVRDHPGHRYATAPRLGAGSWWEPWRTR